MTRNSLLIAAVAPLFVQQMYAQEAKVQPHGPSRAGAPVLTGLVDAGSVGSVERKPSVPFTAAEYPFNDAPSYRERPAAKKFDGVIHEELTMGTQSQSVVTLTTEEAATARNGAVFSSRPTRMDPRATLTSPQTGDTLNPNQYFGWSTGNSATRYWLRVGSCVDCSDIADQDMGTNRAASVNIPTDGRIVYSTLFTEFNGGWYWIDYQFKASTGFTPASLTSPSNGSTLAPSQTFQWNQGSNVEIVWLTIGNCEGCNDMIDESGTGRSSRTVSIPQDGRVIWVTLWSLFNGDWYFREYQFRAPVDVTRSVRVFMNNQLKYDIDLFVNNVPVGRVTAGKNQYADVIVGSSMTVSWSLVRPTLSGRSLGDTMAGQYTTIANPSGTYNFAADNIIGDSWYFQPLITNQTSVGLLMEVNGGYTAENRCDCVAGAGNARVQFGYYRLFTNSNVRVYRNGSDYTGHYRFWGTDSNGTIAAGGELYRSVARGAGELVLTTSIAP